MLERIIKSIASNPWVYDQIQLLAGQRVVYKRLAAQFDKFSSATVLDLGGGTGLYRTAWAAGCTYICLDVDKDKLEQFSKNNPDCKAIMADATDIPLEDKSIDVVVCIAVSHHLTESQFAKLVSESERVLKPTGSFILFDGIRVPNRTISKLMWKYDRGSYPHTREEIQSLISEKFSIVHTEEFAVYHKFVIFHGTKKEML